MTARNELAALPAPDHAGLAEKFEKVIAEEADEYAADAPEAVARGERPDLWEREVTIPVEWLREAAAALSAGVRVKGLEEAARNLINRRFDTYKARNGRRMSIEADDGEKCWIVHFDEMHELELALSALSDAPVVTEEMVDALRLARHELWQSGASESEHGALWHIRRVLSALEPDHGK